jgi:transposase
VGAEQRLPYLASTITKIVNGHPNSHLDELLPWLYPAVTTLRNVA